MCFGIRVIQIFSCQFLVSAGFEMCIRDSFQTEDSAAASPFMKLFCRLFNSNTSSRYFFVKPLVLPFAPILTLESVSAVFPFTLSPLPVIPLIRTAEEASHLSSPLNVLSVIVSSVPEAPEMERIRCAPSASAEESDSLSHL